MSTKLPAQPNQIVALVALLGLLGVGVWLRLRFIHTAQLYPDEFVTLLAVRMIGEKGVPILPSGLFFEHGLLFSYAASVAAWFGPARLTVRYASLLFGLITLGLTFVVGRRWFSTGVALIAVTGLVVAPAAIQWSGRARMYALLQLLVLLTIWLAYEGIVYDRPGRRWAALLAYLGATLTHFNAVALAPPLGLAAVGLWWFKIGAERQSGRGVGESVKLIRQKRLWLEVVALGLILLIAFYVKRAGQPKGVEALAADNALAGLAQVLAIYGDLSLNLAAGWQAINPFYLTRPTLFFAPFALLVGGLALIQLSQRSSRQQIRMFLAGQLDQPAGQTAAWPWPARPPAIFLTIIVFATTLEMILFVSPERRDDKYLFMLLPFFFLLGAHGMEITFRYVFRPAPQPANSSQSQSRTPNLESPISNLQSPLPINHSQFPIHNSPFTIISLLIAGLILTATQPAVRALLANTGDDYDTAFAYVQAHWQPGDTILTGTPAAAAFYLDRNDFYSVQRRGGYDYRLLTVNNRPVDRWLGSPAIRTEAELHQVLANQPVWLVLERWGLQREYYDLPFLQQLLAQTDYVSEAQAQGIFVLRSKANPRPLAAEPAHLAEALFGDRLRLLGYTVEPELPAPGQPVRLTLYWQAIAPPEHDYTVFVHLRQPAGGNVAQADHRPLGDLYSTSLWPVGETIRETSELLLPPDLPPGSYQLWAGLYLLETGERLPVQNDASGENAVELGTVIVE
jgi:hypothetical protein